MWSRYLYFLPNLTYRWTIHQYNILVTSSCHPQASSNYPFLSQLTKHIKCKCMKMRFYKDLETILIYIKKEILSSSISNPAICCLGVPIFSSLRKLLVPLIPLEFLQNEDACCWESSVLPICPETSVSSDCNLP